MTVVPVDPLGRLADELRGLDPLLAHAVVDPPAAAPLGLAAADGPRSAGREQAYAELVEAIHEGYLQHYGEGRVLQTDDPDLALLAGDRLYAFGLARLAELGDLPAIRTLADVISDLARAHAEGAPHRVEGIWQLGVHAVAHGAEPRPGAESDPDGGVATPGSPVPAARPGSDPGYPA